jgi:hypothetical protein
MSKIYLDSAYRCHTSNPDGTFQEVETNSFDGKCATFIEGYRFIPSGESWTRSDGVVFHGEMIAPWKDYNALDATQREYERQLLAEYEAALAEIEAALGV